MPHSLVLDVFLCVDKPDLAHAVCCSRFLSNPGKSIGKLLNGLISISARYFQIGYPFGNGKPRLGERFMAIKDLLKCVALSTPELSMVAPTESCKETIVVEKVFARTWFQATTVIGSFVTIKVLFTLAKYNAFRYGLTKAITREKLKIVARIAEMANSILIDSEKGEFVGPGSSVFLTLRSSASCFGDILPFLVLCLLPYILDIEQD
ncbi:hypothetical protein Tco_0795756 [Tanacetum coccineum]